MKRVPQPSTSTSRPARGPEAIGPAFAGQLIAGAGSILALLGPFSDVVAGVGIAMLIAGVVISAPAGGDPGPVLSDWWSPLAVAALVALAGFGLGFWLPGLGGIVLTGGAVVALASVCFGSPPQGD